MPIFFLMELNHFIYNSFSPVIMMFTYNDMLLIMICHDPSIIRTALCLYSDFAESKPEE